MKRINQLLTRALLGLTLLGFGQAAVAETFIRPTELDASYHLFGYNYNFGPRISTDGNRILVKSTGSYSYLFEKLPFSIPGSPSVRYSWTYESLESSRHMPFTTGNGDLFQHRLASDFGDPEPGDFSFSVVDWDDPSEEIQSFTLPDEDVFLKAADGGHLLVSQDSEVESWPGLRSPPGTSSRMMAERNIDGTYTSIQNLGTISHGAGESFDYHQWRSSLQGDVLVLGEQIWEFNGGSPWPTWWPTQALTSDDVRGQVWVHGDRIAGRTWDDDRKNQRIAIWQRTAPGHWEHETDIDIDWAFETLNYHNFSVSFKGNELAIAWTNAACAVTSSPGFVPRREVRIYRDDVFTALVGTGWGLSGTIRPTADAVGEDVSIGTWWASFGDSVAILDDGSIAVTQVSECSQAENGLFIFDREDIEPVPGATIPGVTTTGPMGTLCNRIGAPCNFINPIFMDRDRITVHPEPKTYSIDPIFWNCQVKWRCHSCEGRLCTGNHRFEFALKDAGLDLGEVELYLVSAKGEVWGKAHETEAGLAIDLSIKEPFEVPPLDELGFAFYFGDVPAGKEFDVPATYWSSNQQDQ